MWVKRTAKVSIEETKEMLEMSPRELNIKGAEIASREGYNPAGYNFQSPQISPDGTFTWESFDSCD